MSSLRQAALASLASAIGLPSLVDHQPSNRATRRGNKASAGHSFIGRGSRTVAQDKREARKKRNQRRNKR